MLTVKNLEVFSGATRIVVTNVGSVATAQPWEQDINIMVDNGDEHVSLKLNAVDAAALINAIHSVRY